MSTHKPIIFCLGANHKSAEIEVRELFHLSDETLTLALPQIREKFGIQELAAISTCNRFEMFGVLSGIAHQEQTFYDAFVAMHRLSPNPNQISNELVRANSYLLFNTEAVKHLFSVAASLDSLVVGETQITGQFKDAIQMALEVETLGPTLHRLCQEALAVAKKVRTQTEIGRKPVSISHAAIDLAKKVFGNISEHKFLIVGAGEMARVAAQHAMNYRPKDLFVANRTLERAERLTEELAFGKAFSLDELPNLLKDSDIVISSTGAQKSVISYKMIERTRLERRGRPLFLIDIAIPRDIDPNCSELDDIYLFDIDDLQQVVNANYQERRLAANAGQHLIESAALGFEKWLDSLTVKPTLSSFRGYLKDLAHREFQKTLNRELFRSLGPEQKAALENMVNAFIAKVLADAGRNLRMPPEGYYPDQLADALRLLFPNPEPESPEDES